MPETTITETTTHPQTSAPAAARAARIASIYADGVASAKQIFDPDRHLVYQAAAQDPHTRTYRPASSLPLAYALLRQADGSPPDQAAIDEAVAILQAVLASQEMARHNPHRGNWLWLADDHEVCDLNAVQFILRGLLPVLVDFSDYLPTSLLEQCKTSVRLSLEEEERIDVAPTYSNIHLMSLFGLLIGGQWLKDEYFLDLGRRRWDRWVRFTLQSGAPHEYNSPGYGSIDLLTLDAIHRLTTDRGVRLQAALLYERVLLHLLVHLHVPTRQHAGPHCRAYWGQMQSGRSTFKELVWRDTGWPWLSMAGAHGGKENAQIGLDFAFSALSMPSYATSWLENQVQAYPFEVREIANVEEGFDLTTYFAPNYVLGTASRTYGIGTECFYIEHQANYLVLHYTRPQVSDAQISEAQASEAQVSGGWGMMYSRYVVNDLHWGKLAAAPDRSATHNFYDHGHFAGAQLKNKAIGLYALMPQHEEVHSLKTVIAFQSGGDLEQVWINDGAVALDQPLPDLQLGDWLLVVDGGAYIGVRPLEPTCLGREAPIRLERGPLGELWLAIYNYQGAPKRFWDYASLKGAFWRGNLHAGFIVEVANRDEYASAAEFLAYLQTGDIQDTVDQDTVDDKMLRTIRYRNGEDSLALQYDLWHTLPGARFLNGQRYTPPNLVSPLAIQGDSGDLQLGSARLQTHPQQVWLIAQEGDPTQQMWVAVNPEQRPTPLRLETPHGVITAGAWGMGRIEWRVPASGEPIIYISGVEQPQNLSVPHGTRVIPLNDSCWPE